MKTKKKVGRGSASKQPRSRAEKELTNKPRKKPERIPAKPRFFERARPNQLWQSDIMTFRLAGMPI
jgi:hypothetical protein